MRGFVKLLIVFLFISLLIFVIYWLWQRQPKAVNNPIQSITNIVTGKNNSEQEAANPFSLNITDFQVTDSATLKITGTVNPNSYVLIFSNSKDQMVLANEAGNFETNFELNKNLNLASIVEVDKDFNISKQQALTLYLLEKNSPIKATTVYAGSVKSIFNNVITLTTTSGEKKVKSDSQTIVNLPKSQSPTPKAKQSPQPEKADIRVGDYIIVLGNSSQDTELKAISVDIIRENKPEITKKYALAVVSSVVKNKLFAVKNLKDSSIVEFKLDKNSQILSESKKTDEKAIIKDRKVIIFYRDDKENIVASLYLLS